MKKYLISLIAILWSLAGFAQHFTSAHAGTNAEAYMTIRVFSGVIGGVNMQSGDEIGVFDGGICVGSKVLTGALVSTVTVNAAKKDVGLSNGYTSGHSISVKIWDSSASTEYDATVVVRPDSPFSVFTDNESAYLNISAKESLTINLTAQNKSYDGTDNATVGYTIPNGSISSGVTVSVTNGKFSNKNIGTGKTVTASISTSGTDAGNYNFTINNTATADITARPITITADAKSKSYGDADPVFTAQITTGSVISGDVATGALGRAAGTAIGDYAINKGTYTYGSNYTETFVSANLTIGIKAISIRPDAKSKGYGGTDPALTFQAVPALVSGDSFTGAISRSAGEALGTYNYTMGNLSASSNYSLTFEASNVFTISTKVLSLSGLSVIGKVYDGNTTATLSGTASLSGILGSESVSLNGTPNGAFVSANAGNSIAVNITGLSLSGANAGNYTLNNSITGNITPKELTVSGAVAQNKVYDGTTAAVISGANLLGKIGSDDVTVTIPAVGVFAQKGVGTDITVSASTMTLSGAAAGNYSLAYPTGLKASISKKDLTITAKNKTKCIGTIASFSGTDFLAPELASGDAITSVSLVSSGSAATAVAGVYDIIASNAVGTGLANYTISYVSGKLTAEELPVPTISGSAPVTQVPAQVVYTTEAGMTNYVWSITSGGTINAGAGSRQVTVSWSSMTNQSITVTYNNSNGCSGTYTRAITLSSLPTAVLSGSATVCQGSGATLNVALTGIAPWKIVYSDGTTSKTITGISTNPYTFQVIPLANTTTTYTITNVTDGNDMTNSGAGSAVVTSLPSYVAPTIAAVNDLCYGANDAVIRATVSGNQSSSVKYLWQSSVDNITWIDIDNSNTLTYSPGEMYNSVYYRMAAYITGCENKISNTIKVNVHEPITNAVISCEKQNLCFGDAPAVLSSTPSSGGNGSFNYQWQQKTSGSWVNVGANSLTYQPTSLTSTTTFRVISRDRGVPSCGSVYSNELVITLGDPILAGKISADQKIVNGATPAAFASVTAGSGSGTISYSWELSVDNGLTWTKISGATNATYASGALTQPTWFRRITISMENLVSCTSASDPVKISMWPTGVDNPENGKDNWSAYSVSNTEIRLKGEVSENAIATLYDIQGKVILVKNLEEGTLNVIPTPSIKNGVYLLFVVDKELIQKFKIPVWE